MRQIGLFDAGSAYVKSERGGTSSHSKTSGVTGCTGLKQVSFYPDFASWWIAASQCLQQNMSPSGVWWVEDRNAPRENNASVLKVYPAAMREFAQEAKAASCHRNEDRWALLYSIRWRLANNEPQLMELSGDTQVAKLHQYTKAVARDVHKMKAFVRFRKVDGITPDDIPRYVSWFEPEHYIVEYAAPFFTRRFSNMHWSILTPVGCAHWEGAVPISGPILGQGTGQGSGQGSGRGVEQDQQQLWFSDPLDKNLAPAAYQIDKTDQFEGAWRVYYKSIFNPARLKIGAMQSEMPKKYWKNLPEAKEIATLVAAAESRTHGMIDQRKSEDSLHCGARPAHPDAIVHHQIKHAAASSLQSLRLEASLCTSCPQSVAATQTVFGEGPEDAKLMIIGEQPGDEEDLHGKPFVGPAGQVLNAALKRAGIDRELCYLTNAVKHFGFVPRGKKRLHKRPDAAVVGACGRWLQHELNCVNPDIVVYLGATAASTQFGRQVRVSRDRGKLITRDNRQHLITAHPSSILRADQGVAQQNAYRQFVSDLMLCADLLQQSAL
jgi:DNA polymerase